jgi:hypothetical protein
VTVLGGGRPPRGFGGFGGDGRGSGSGDDVWDAESWEEPPRGRDQLGGGR